MNRLLSKSWKLVLLAACALLALVLSFLPVQRASADETDGVSLLKAAPMQEIGAVYEVHFYLNYECAPTVAGSPQVYTTEEQEDCIFLNGYSLSDLRDMYVSPWFYSDWRAETDEDDGLTKRTLVISIDKMHPFGYKDGENEITLKAGLVTPDSKTVDSNSSLSFSTPNQGVAITDVSVLDQGSIGYRYIMIEFDIEPSFYWNDAANITPSLAGYIIVNGQRLETVPDYQALFNIVWERNDLGFVGTGTHMDLCFIGHPEHGTGFLKEGENIITVKKGMQVHWNGDAKYLNRQTDKDYTFIVNISSSDGDGNDSASLQPDLQPEWDSLTVPSTVEYGDALTLPQAVPCGEREIPLIWETVNTSVLGETKMIASIPFDYAEAISAESRYKEYTVTVQPKKVTAEDVGIVPDFSTLTASVTYGQSLADAALSGGMGAGTFAFKNPDTQPTVAQSGTEFDVVFTPTDTENYDWSSVTLEGKVAVTVNKAQGVAPDFSGLQAAAITYGQSLAEATLSGGTGAAGTFAFKNPDTQPTVAQSGTEFDVVFTPTDMENYDWSGVTLEGKVTVTVNKAQGVAPDFGTLQAAAITYGQSLAEATLSGGTGAGTFAFKDSTAKPTVAQSGNEFDVVFTPTDMENYDWSGVTLEGKVTVTVNKAQGVAPDFSGLSAAAITYGQSLADATLSGGTGAGTFAFKNPDTKPTVAQSGTEFDVVFTPTDTENYDWSSVTLEGKVAVTVNKAATEKPDISAWETLAADEESRLGNIALPEGYEWKNPEELVKAGENSYTVVYTPEDENYASVELTVTVRGEEKGCGSSIAGTAGVWMAVIFLLGAAAAIGSKMRNKKTR